MADEDIFDALRKYLEEGDHDGFASRDPWVSISGDGGLDSLLEKLAANVTTVDECPEEDCAMSAMQLGQIAGNANLTPKE